MHLANWNPLDTDHGEDIPQQNVFAQFPISRHAARTCVASMFPFTSTARNRMLLPVGRRNGPVYRCQGPRLSRYSMPATPASSVASRDTTRPPSARIVTSVEIGGASSVKSNDADHVTCASRVCPRMDGWK